MKKQVKKPAVKKSLAWAEFALLCENYWAKVEGDDETTYVPMRSELGDGFEFRAEMIGELADETSWIFLKEDNETLKLEGWEVVAIAASGLKARINFLRVITDIPEILKKLE